MECSQGRCIPRWQSGDILSQIEQEKITEKRVSKWAGLAVVGVPHPPTELPTKWELMAQHLVLHSAGNLDAFRDRNNSVRSKGGGCSVGRKGTPNTLRHWQSVRREPHLILIRKGFQMKTFAKGRSLVCRVKI